MPVSKQNSSRLTRDKEARSRIMKLDCSVGDDAATWRMLQHLYGLPCITGSEDTEEMATLFLIADHYRIPSLRSIVLEDLKTRYLHNVEGRKEELAQDEEFHNALQLAFSVEANDKSLQELLADTCKKLMPYLLLQEDFMRMVSKTPCLAARLWSYMHETIKAAKPLYECSDCKEEGYHSLTTKAPSCGKLHATNLVKCGIVLGR